MSRVRLSILRGDIRHRGWLVALSGVVLMLLGIISGAVTVSPAPWYASQVTVSLLATVGATLLVLGSVDIFVQTEGTIVYFEERLKAALEETRPGLEGTVHDAVGSAFGDNNDRWGEMLNRAMLRDIGDPTLLQSLKDGSPAEFARLRVNTARVAMEMDLATVGEDGELLRVMHDEIEPLLGHPHFEGMLIKYDCRVVRDCGEPHIAVRRSMEATVHSLNTTTVDLGFETRVRRIRGIDDNTLYHLESFTVNGEERVAPEDCDRRTEGERINVRVPLSVRMEHGEALELRRVERLVVPLGDVFTWSVRPERSVRSIHVICGFNEEVYPRLTAHGFGTIRTIEENPMDCSLRFVGWMLPHQGFVISWNDPCTSAAKPLTAHDLGARNATTGAIEDSTLSQIKPNS